MESELRGMRLVIEGLRKSFFQGIDSEVLPGEFVAIVERVVAVKVHCCV